MRLLITGATGYLGSRVLAAARAGGLAVETSAVRLQSLAPGSLAFDAVVHCAGALRRRADRLWPDNVEATRALAAALARPAHLVFVSTRSVYPLRPQQAVDESVPPDPWDDYGRSKLAAERALSPGPHAVTIVRVPTLFGHPERDGCFLDRAAGLAWAGRPIDLAQPDRLDDALEVDALAQALLMLSRLAAPAGTTRTWNIAGPHRPLSEVLDGLGAALAARRGDRALELRRVPIPVPPTPLLDDAAFRAAFPHWSPRSDAEVFRAKLAAAPLSP